MTAEDVPDGSVDVVVSSYVASLTEDNVVYFRNIKRMLAPGGRFYFWEQVLAPDNTWHYYLHHLVRLTGLWTLLSCGDDPCRRPQDQLLKAGFKSVGYANLDVLGPFDFSVHWFIMYIGRFVICGVAIK